MKYECNCGEEYNFKEPIPENTNPICNLCGGCMKQAKETK